MKTFSRGSIPPDLVTCAKFLGGDYGSYKWCHKKATMATSCEAHDYSGSVYYHRIGHFYCDEHAPREADVIIID